MSQLPEHTFERDLLRSEQLSGAHFPSLRGVASRRLLRRTAQLTMFAAADVLAFGVSLAVVTMVLPAFEAWGRLPIDRVVDIAAALAVVPFAAACLGLYGSRRAAPPEALRQRFVLLGCLFAVVAAGFTVGTGEPGHVAALGAVLVIGLPLSLVTEHLAHRLLIRIGCWAAPTVLVGMTDENLRLAERLSRNADLGLRPVGIVDDRPETWGRVVGGLRVLGPVRTIDGFRPRIEAAALVASGDIDEAAAGIAERPFCERLVVVTDLDASRSLWTRSRDLGGGLAVEFDVRAAVPADWRVKRVFDCVVAVPLLVFFVPLILTLALWIKIVSPGPAFYRQERAGRNGRPIQVLKLRSMYRDAEARLEEHLARDEDARREWDRYCKLSRDPRILPGIGPLIRKASLDELPQLWNVIRGDMSLVGPRPFPSYHLEKFPAEFTELRTQVPPGITGLWQVSSRSDGDLDVQAREDTAYIRNWSLWLDLHILIRTIPAVLFARGSR